MANKEHLEVLNRGVDVWNEWRKDNPGIIPNLIGADLSEADLREANLREAKLIGAKLVGAKLVGANLIGVDLIEAKLVGANLREADLIGAKLVRANLSGTNLMRAKLHRANLSAANLSAANLRAANLIGADLSEADLRNVDLARAILGSTIFFLTDLSSIKNLETCEHRGPSSIDQTTLTESGKLPEKFLRGCGLSNEFIEYIPFLFWEKQAFEFYSCFISYSSKDEEFAKRLHADLQDNGVRCWFAPEDLKIGDKFRSVIDQSIRVYDKLLLILSENSLNSTWVENEVESAFEKEEKSKDTVLFPIRLDEAVMDTGAAWAKTIKRSRHIGDFSRWKEHDAYQEAFQRLLRDLKGG